MSQPIIEVKGISKRYQLGTIGATTLRDEFHRWWQHLRNGKAKNGQMTSDPLSTNPSPQSGEFWALRDISFEVRQGEVLGIIGRNGAGKSTLLKILSRITEPTAGEIRVRGRVASLLEVGTGFHPDLTGRENVFLNGAILGMTKAEIRKKFDEIVAFAEVENFIDTPVKRYSSGMYVRLAFAVAAHLDPEILIVDEVLAVGDAEFQKKCLGKMRNSSREGRTVLFVSHNLMAVESLCSKTILLEKGCTRNIGNTIEVIEHYLSKARHPTSTIEFSELTPRLGTGEGRFIGLKLQDREGRPISRILTCQPLIVEMRFKAQTNLPSTRIGILIKNQYDNYICDIRAEYVGRSFSVRAGKHYVFYGIVDSLPLYPGKYTMGIWMARGNSCGEDVDFIPDACHLFIDSNKSLVAQGELDPQWGQFFLASKWQQLEMTE